MHARGSGTELLKLGPLQRPLLARCRVRQTLVCACTVDPKYFHPTSAKSLVSFLPSWSGPVCKCPPSAHMICLAAQKGCEQYVSFWQRLHGPCSAGSAPHGASKLRDAVLPLEGLVRAVYNHCQRALLQDARPPHWRSRPQLSTIFFYYQGSTACSATQCRKAKLCHHSAASSTLLT